ncbi:MAG: xanthine dehydrogenase family protein subunit M [Chitinophagaceae bacterium]|nr:MAG: xanthine dehydrogenase family protein subunit M [Chitinophagaceae bacterium]
MINFDYIKVTTEQGAIAAGKDASAQYIAGGTNLVDLMKRGVTNPEKLVDITDLSLRGIEQRGKTIFIGALALNSEVATNQLVQQNIPLLSQALHAGASPQIRNMATVGGNMLQRTRCGYFYDLTMPCNKRTPNSGCAAKEGYNRMHAIFGTSEQCIAVHPSDMCVALVALDATVLVTNAKSTRRIPFINLHKLPGNDPHKDNTLLKGELITGVEVPINTGLATHSLYTKIRDRASYAFALVSVAAAMDMNGKTIKEVRLAMGGVAHKPWRLTAAEQFLKGKEATETNFRQAASLVMKGARGYGHNNFKLKLAPNTIFQTLQTLAGI